MARPYLSAPSKTRFYLPPTLADDFRNFLDGDLPNQVMDFELVNDWFDRTAEDYEPVIIRGELYPDSTKSRYINMDHNLNFRADVESGIRKGDMIVASNNGQVYLLDWHVSLESNNAPSRALVCNSEFVFERFVDEEVDDDGYRISGPGYKAITGSIPCNIYRYDGRPEYTETQGTPGVSPKALTILTVQMNDQTDKVHINDTFMWDTDRYMIVDIDRTGTSQTEDFGTLRFQCNKEAGGLHYD